MNIIGFSITAFIVILTITAILFKGRAVRTITTSIVFILLVFFCSFAFHAVARGIISDSLKNETFNDSYHKGVLDHYKGTTPHRIIIVVCGAGLFTISLIPNRKKYNDNVKK